MRDAYAARFVGESFDRAWSTDATTTLREQVVPHLPADAALVDLECRTTVCKLTTSHHDVGAYRAFLQSSLFAPEFKWGGPMTGGIVRTDPNGEVVTVAYLTRPGAKPPTVGQEEARD
jgi:hypothetical protein